MKAYNYIKSNRHDQNDTIVNKKCVNCKYKLENVHYSVWQPEDKNNQKPAGYSVPINGNVTISKLEELDGNTIVYIDETEPKKIGIFTKSANK